jgi:glycosyltransferase involved in cell wall biosynthesis
MSQHRDLHSLVFVWGITKGVGGTETRMAEVAQALNSRAVTVSSVILTADQPSRLVDLLTSAGTAPKFSPRWIHLVKIFRATRPDAILTFGLRASLWVRLASWFIGSESRLIDARNGLEMSRSRFTWLLDRLTQWPIDVFLTNSEPARQELLRHGVGPGRVLVVNSGLGTEWSQLQSVERDPERVIIVGNARPEKNHELGLEAIARAQGEVKAVIYTDNADHLRALWASLEPGSGKQVTFVESHAVRPAEMATAAVLLHPSRSESYPRVLLEAISQGLHVVATDVGDTRRIVGDCVLLAPADDLRTTVKLLDQALSRSRLGIRPERRPARTVDDYCTELMAICGIKS